MSSYTVDTSVASKDMDESTLLEFLETQSVGGKELFPQGDSLDAYEAMRGLIALANDGQCDIDTENGDSIHIQHNN